MSENVRYLAQKIKFQDSSGRTICQVWGPLTIAHMLVTSSAVTSVYRLVLNSCIKTEIRNFLEIFQMFALHFHKFEL